MMEESNIIFCVLALLGITIHALMKFKKRSDKSTKFNFKWWIKDNWINFALSILSIVTLFLMGGEILSYLGMTLEDGSPAEKIGAFCIGYFNHSLIRNVLGNVERKMGQNQDANQGG